MPTMTCTMRASDAYAVECMTIIGAAYMYVCMYVCM